MTFKSSYWLRESRKASRYPCLFGEIINRLFLRAETWGKKEDWKFADFHPATSGNTF
jgi:hypothetical protein